jgi:hypothetical protein
MIAERKISLDDESEKRNGRKIRPNRRGLGKRAAGSFLAERALDAAERRIAELTDELEKTKNSLAELLRENKAAEDERAERRRRETFWTERAAAFGKDD